MEQSGCFNFTRIGCLISDLLLSTAAIAFFAQEDVSSAAPLHSHSHPVTLQASNSENARQSGWVLLIGLAGATSILELLNSRPKPRIRFRNTTDSWNSEINPNSYVG